MDIVLPILSSFLLSRTIIFDLVMLTFLFGLIYLLLFRR